VQNEEETLSPCEASTLLGIVKYFKMYKQGVYVQRLHAFLKDKKVTQRIPAKSTIYVCCKKLLKKGFVTLQNNLYVPTELGEKYAYKLIESEQKNFERKLRNRLELFTEILDKVPRVSAIYRDSLKVILHAYFEALYADYEEIANNAFNALEKFASGMPETLIALELEARLKDKEETWRRLAEEKVKYGKRLSLKGTTFHEAPYFFYDAARIEELKLKDELKAEKHYKKALGMLIDLILSQNIETFEIYYDKSCLLNALYLSEKLSLPQVRKILLTFVYAILKNKLERAKKSSTLIRERDVYEVSDILSYLNEDEKKNITPLISELLENLMAVLEQELLAEKDFERSGFLHRIVANLYRLLKDEEEKAKHHFRKAFEYSCKIVKDRISKKDSSSALAWLLKAAEDLSETGEDPWSCPDIRELAHIYIEENHEIIEELLSSHESWIIRHLEVLIGYLSKCERLCASYNKDEHLELCKAVRDKLMEISEELWKSGDLHSALRLYFSSAKISKHLSKELEKECVERIESIIDALKTDMTSYATLVYNRDLNNYLYEFYASVNDGKRMLEYKRKLVISEAASRTLKYVDKYYDMVIRGALRENGCWKDSKRYEIS
jgi:hypothetical protein